MTNCEKRGLETERFHSDTRKKYESKQKISHNLIIVHYDTSAMKRFLTSVSLQHEPKASDVILRNFISRGMKMRISAREACVKPHLRTRSDIKILISSVATQ